MELKTRQLDESFAQEVLELQLDHVDDESFAALKALWQEYP